MTRCALLAVTVVVLCGCGAETEATFKRSPPPGVSPPAPSAMPSPGAATSPPAPSAPTPSTAPPPRPAASPPPPLRPELSPEEEQRLAEGARQNISDVQRLITELQGRPLKPPQRESLQTAMNFLDQARTALGQRDYPRAANLASKARALTDELAATSK